MERKHIGLSSSSLHIIAMVLMLCDHSCMTLFGNQIWLHYIGRIAYPIFAFMTVEGFRHTGNMKKYILRLFLFAIISEIPFDLMCGGALLFLTQQNVLWTYLIGIFSMLIIEQTKNIQKTAVRFSLFILTTLLTLLISYIVGIVTMVDYFGGGVVMILIFYLFRNDEILTFKRKYSKKYHSTIITWMNRIFQVVFVWNICNELIGGLCCNISIFGRQFEVVVESFGILALIPIWLYNGKKGINSKSFKYFCYSFYPVHMLLLVFIKLINR